MRRLRYFGDPVLREQAEEVGEITDEIRELVSDMIRIMDSKNGIGLAATQVGVSLKVLIIRPEIEREDGSFFFGDPVVYINPVISNPTEEKSVMSEGCLSVPGIHKEVERPVGIDVKAIDLDGNEIFEVVRGFKAREIMHENDHLNGKLFIDRLSKEDRKEIEKELLEIKKKYGSGGE